jgi:hypothetical protein
VVQEHVRLGELVALVPSAQLREGRAVVVVDTDEEALGEEAVHLDQAILVRRGAVEDEEEEVVVVVELRALVEALGVLERKRVKAEGLAEDREVALGGAVDVEPEEVAVLEPGLELVTIERGDRAVAGDEVAQLRCFSRTRAFLPTFERR